MSTDGASLGIAATRALKTVLGGEPAPTEDEFLTRSQVLGRMETATPATYDGSCDVMARDFYRMFRDHPETRGLRDGWVPDYPEGEYVSALSDAYKEYATPDGLEVYDECTGFMFGYAVNLARWLLQEPPVPNPAIVVLG